MAPAVVALIGGARGGTLARHNNNKVHALGRYHVFHIEDIRRIAPRWLAWEKVIRMNPQKYWSLKDPKTGVLLWNLFVDDSDWRSAPRVS